MSPSGLFVSLTAKPESSIILLANSKILIDSPISIRNISPPFDIDEDCTTPEYNIDNPWNVEIEWQWNGLGDEPFVDQVMVAPIVGNLTDDNGDGGCSSGCDETTSTTVCLDSVSFELAWTSGQYDGEVSFELLAQDGTSVCSEGANPSTPCGGLIVPTCDQL
mgnify:CR=1 FL=1